MNPPPVVSAVIVSLWSVALGAGVYFLMDYESTPGQAAAAPAAWPGNSRVKLNRDRATLVMFAHPQCPCTRASIAELGELMAKGRDRIDAYVLFLTPKSASPGWEKSDLWHSAAAIPGVTVLQDVNHEMADRFESVTSGQALVYDPAGRLIFSGGVTAARGQTGQHFAINNVLFAIDKHASESRSTLVFGCPLPDPK